MGLLDMVEGVAGGAIATEVGGLVVDKAEEYFGLKKPQTTATPTETDQTDGVDNQSDDSASADLSAQDSSADDSSADDSSAATDAAPEMQTYTVQPGDSLSKISEKFYGNSHDYLKIFEANQDSLGDPNDIEVGQQLNIPTA